MKKPLLFDDRAGRELPATDGDHRARGVVLVGLLFLLTRLVVWTGAYVGGATSFCIQCGIAPPLERHLPEVRERLADPQSREYQAARRALWDFAPLTRFDGGHYKSIIEQGYTYSPDVGPTGTPGGEYNIAFFPLYPLICLPLARLVTTNAALVLAAHVCALAAVILFYLWIRRRVNEETALFGVACLLCWPAAGYYSFGYAESLTLLLTVGTLTALDRRAFVLAAVLCGLATATRATAAALIPVCLLGLWLNHPAPRVRRAALLLPLTFVAAVGLIGYAAYLTYRFGSPLVYLDNFRAGWTPDHQRADWLQYLTMARVWDQFKYFGRVIGGFPYGLVELANPFTWNMPLNFFIIFLSLLGMRRVPRSFRPLLWLGPLIFLQAYVVSGGATFGVQPMSRYTMLAVPAFVVLAAWCVRDWRPATRYGLLTFMLLIQAAWAFRFGLGEWSS